MARFDRSRGQNQGQRPAGFPDEPAALTTKQEHFQNQAGSSAGTSFAARNIVLFRNFECLFNVMNTAGEYGFSHLFLTFYLRFHLDGTGRPAPSVSLR